MQPHSAYRYRNRPAEIPGSRKPGHRFRPVFVPVQVGNDRRGCSTASMLSRESVDLEQRLAKLVGADPADVRSYLYEVIEERLWGRNPKERKTGFRFIR